MKDFADSSVARLIFTIVHLNASIQFCLISFSERFSCVQWGRFHSRSYLSDNSISRACPNSGDCTPTVKTGNFKI